MSRIAVVVKGYPRLSETFIAQEILGLQKRGVDQLIVSLRHPTDPHLHDLHREITADVLYLPEYLKDDPKRVARARRWAEKQPGYARALAAFKADLERDHSANRYRRFGQACVFAHELPEDVTWLHTHYLHTPASVTRYAALILGMEWSFSAHAKDIWTSPAWELREKLDSSAWGVTCTRVNVDYLNGLGKRKDAVELVYHGLDFSRFPSPPSTRAMRDGSGDPVRILSVGRLVEKKGYDDLIAALARLPDDLAWHFDHIGGGALKKRLQARAEKAGIADRITWHGAQPREAVIEACINADLFVLSSRIARSGDRDGLPNVLMEAQSLGLCCLSTRVSAIPELIEDGRTGVLVEPHDPADLATALEALARDPARRQAIGTEASQHVRSAFSSKPGIDRLAEKLRASG
ncbi:glycosyltransferase family 4 protein [Breoghania sp.]|uniref:glycosyltransferase family 4 protein n=1 Tax=Breoghania sp. TaxID=2065378 RepID=UPI002AAB50E1|nr:glycosyltransferase family 4 protein [Breoghania sp.]